MKGGVGWAVCAPAEVLRLFGCVRGWPIPPEITGFSSFIKEHVFICCLSALSSFIEVCEVVFFSALELHLPSVMPFRVAVLATQPLEILNLRVC